MDSGSQAGKLSSCFFARQPGNKPLCLSISFHPLAQNLFLAYLEQGYVPDSALHPWQGLAGTNVRAFKVARVPCQSLLVLQSSMAHRAGVFFEDSQTAG